MTRSNMPVKLWPHALGAAGVAGTLLGPPPLPAGLMPVVGWAADALFRPLPSPCRSRFPAANPRLCYVAGMDYEVLCGEWGGNKASRLGGGNRAANNTHTGLKSGAAAAGAADAQGCAKSLPPAVRRMPARLQLRCWPGRCLPLSVPA